MTVDAEFLRERATTVKKKKKKKQHNSALITLTLIALMPGESVADPSGQGCGGGVVKVHLSLAPFSALSQHASPRLSPVGALVSLAGALSAVRHWRLSQQKELRN